MGEHTEIYRRNGAQAVYLITVGLSILFNVFDSSGSVIKTDGKIYLNLATILILALSLLFFYLKLVDIKRGFTILAYAILVSTIGGFYFQMNFDGFLPLLLRNSIFIIIVISISAFALNKNHVPVFTFIFLTNLIILSIISGNEFLLKNIAGICIVIFFFALSIYYILNIRDRQVKLIEHSNSIVREQHEEIFNQNAQLLKQREELTLQHEKMELQTKMLEEKNKDIYDNFIFGRSIQNSILPKESEYLNYLPNSFILQFSKDEISGDFYWIREKCGKLFIAAVDCTGHGVSGALVSMIGFMSLNRALVEILNPSPAEILNKLDSIFQSEFNHTNEDFNAQIGMDIALVVLDLEKHKLEYSGAYNPLYIVRSGELLKLDANHYMLGIEVDEFFHQFENQVIEILPGDSIYLFSDGIADQFGGPKGKKFTYSRLRDLLVEISSLEMAEQKEEIRRVWEEWKGNLKQTDDVLIMGIRL